MNIDPREFGVLEANVAQLQREVRELSTKVDALLALAERGRGAWWTVTLMAGALSSALTLALKYLIDR